MSPSIYSFNMCHYILLLTAEVCQQTFLWTDIRDHHMEKEETVCQVTDVWQEDNLAQRRAGSSSACFSGYTPGVQWWGEPFRDEREHS